MAKKIRRGTKKFQDLYGSDLWRGTSVEKAVINNMEKKKVYKLVKVYAKKRVSALVDVEGVTVRYYKMKWTKPELANSYLFAFDTFESAYKFSNGWAHFKRTRKRVKLPFKERGDDGSRDEIWECEAKHILPASGMSSRFLKTDLINFWQGRDVVDTNVPEGTVWCDEIRLIKRVFPDSR